jgi:predicted nuclease with TOPRIM domain
MTDAGFEMSNQAVAVIFGSGGILAGMVTQWIGSRKVKAPSAEDCRRTHEENAKQHEELFKRIGKLEGDRREDRAILEATRDGVARIEGKIDKLMM